MWVCGVGVGVGWCLSGYQSLYGVVMEIWTSILEQAFSGLQTSSTLYSVSIPVCEELAIHS